MSSSRSSSQYHGGSASVGSDVAAVGASAPDKPASSEELRETSSDTRSTPSASRDVSSNVSVDPEAQLTAPVPESFTEGTAAQEMAVDSALPLPALQPLSSLQAASAPSIQARTTESTSNNTTSSTASPPVDPAASPSSASTSVADVSAADALPELSENPPASTSSVAVPSSPANRVDGVSRAQSPAPSTESPTSAPSSSTRPEAPVHPQPPSVLSTGVAASEQRVSAQATSCEEDTTTERATPRPLSVVPGGGRDARIRDASSAAENEDAARTDATTEAEEDGQQATAVAVPVTVPLAGASAASSVEADKTREGEEPPQASQEEPTAHTTVTTHVAAAASTPAREAAEVQAEDGDTSAAPGPAPPTPRAASIEMASTPSRKRRRAPLANATRSARRAAVAAARLDKPDGEQQPRKDDGEDREGEAEEADGAPGDEATSPAPALAEKALETHGSGSRGAHSGAVEGTAMRDAKRSSTSAEAMVPVTPLEQPAPAREGDRGAVEVTDGVPPAEDEERLPTDVPRDAAAGGAVVEDKTTADGEALPESETAAPHVPLAGGLTALVHAAGAHAGVPSAAAPATPPCPPSSSPTTSSASAPPAAAVAAAGALPDTAPSTSTSSKTKSKRRAPTAATATAGADAAVGAPSGSAAGKEGAPSGKPVLNLAGVNVQALLAEGSDPPPLYTRRQRRTRRKAALAEDHPLFAEHRDLWEHDVTGRIFPRAPFATDAEVLGSLTEWADSPALVYAQLLWRYAPGPFVQLAMRDLDSTPYAKAEAAPSKAESCVKREDSE